MKQGDLFSLRNAYFTLICCGICIYLTRGTTMQDTNLIRDLILTNYSSDTLPIADQSAILFINASLYLRSIIDLDEPKGELITTMAITMAWIDDNLKWDGSNYGYQYSIRIKQSEVWTPTIVLGNPGSSMESIMAGDAKAIVFLTGLVSVGGTNVINTVCDLDVTYFPFDVQKCDVMFQTWDYGPNVKFNAVSSTIDLSTFIENGVWSVMKTELSTHIDAAGYTSSLCASLYLERRSLFYVLNFLAPILILVLLNSMVFLLPTDSGERVGFAVTLLLSIAVYMTIISDKLPETSNPTSILSYILIAYLLQSAFMCIEIVASLSLFHRDDARPVGIGWITFTSFIQCKAFNKSIGDPNAVRVVPDKGIFSDNEQKDFSFNEKTSRTCNSMTDIHVTWSKVSKLLDKCFFYLNIFVVCLLVISYFISISRRPKY